MSALKPKYSTNLKIIHPPPRQAPTSNGPMSRWKIPPEKCLAQSKQQKLTGNTGRACSVTEVAYAPIPINKAPPVKHRTSGTKLSNSLILLKEHSSKNVKERHRLPTHHPRKFLHEMIAERSLLGEGRPPPSTHRVHHTERPQSGLHVNYGDPLLSNSPHISQTATASIGRPSNHTYTSIHGTINKRAEQKRKKKLPPNRKAEEQQLQAMSRHQQLKYLAKKSHFNITEVCSLLTMFQNITTLSGTPNLMHRNLFKQIFTELFQITDSVMLDRIFNFFDADGEGSIAGTEWIQNLSVIIRGTIEEHIKYCFHCYDLNGDGSLGREEVMVLIQSSLDAKQSMEDDGDEDVFDSLKDLANLLVVQFDTHGKAFITIDTYREAVLDNPIALQSLGQCLPDESMVRAFLALLTEDYFSYSTNYSVPMYPGYANDRQKYEPVLKDV